MIKHWTKLVEYQAFLEQEILEISKTDFNRVESFRDTILKLSSLDLDPLFDALKPYYSLIGRAATHQAEIFRSFILMSLQGELSITNWVKTLASDKLLAILIGCRVDDLPPVGSYYDFIDRLWLRKKTLEKQRRKVLRKVTRKPTKKIGKNKKLPNKHPGIIVKIKNFLAKGRSFDQRPERLMQEIMSLVAVVPSIELGLIDNKKLTVSGDGTCVHVNSSSYGVKVCDCRKNGVYDCKCDRRFSDTDARWGYDSSIGQYFYGHTLYVFSCYNAKYKIDLPLNLRFVDANRHDSVSGIVALAELREITPNLKIENVCFDSANDNYATYELLKHWNIKAFIDLNHDVGAKPTYPPALSINENGVPLCQGGFEMVCDGYCKNRSRIKWRCPLKCSKVADCACTSNCSPSSYGRVIYTKPDWDLRLFTPVPRGSLEFKTIFKTRSGSERINNRILNDYSLQKTRIQGKKRFSFFALIAAINIHLDARLKVQKLKQAS